MDEINTHGGKRTGSGRKPKPDDEKVVKVTIYLKPENKPKLKLLGGSKYANMMIENDFDKL